MPLIISSGGIAYTDTPLEEFGLIEGRHYILADPKNPLDQIKKCLSKTDDMKQAIVDDDKLGCLTWQRLHDKISVRENFNNMY